METASEGEQVLSITGTLTRSVIVCLQYLQGSNNACLISECDNCNKLHEHILQHFNRYWLRIQNQSDEHYDCSANS